MRRFRYLLDPLFLLCLITYLVNRFVLKRIWTTGFVHEHLNDLMCIPFWVPILLFVQRKAGLRDGHDPPRSAEIIIPLILWSWIFAILLPAAGWLGDRGIFRSHVDGIRQNRKTDNPQRRQAGRWG